MGLQETLDNFNPNAPEIGKWATFVTGNTPHFRVHGTRAPALTRTLAYSSYGGAILFHFDARSLRWVEVARAAKALQDAVCSICTGTTRSGPLNNDNGVYKWQKKQGKIAPIPVLLYLCPTCARRGY